ncbi:hypothetical protein Zmor_005034 [Zophobas morio]|uniref:PHD-type domain-containing protein n=1 Tax=Zophobas morio TaxID=2755281 RepID=A0AA38MLZ1_9CUCU|nr:hypothetical protein Zmor_013629 [Zophobas morio]KAJ3660593.1 hypothetical protein Zmor_005034 [Zophobas morio]
MPVVCNKCNKSANDNDVIVCDLCKSSIHSICAGLSRQESECVRLKKSKLRYFCDKCNIVEIIGGLRAEVEKLRSEVAELKYEKTGNVLNKLLSEEEIISEVDDRQRRATNLIVYNLPESDDKTVINSKQDDISQFAALVSSEEWKNEIVPDKCFRLGKKVENKRRPLLINFKSSTVVLSILRNYKAANNIYMNRDLTARQRNIAYLVREEFRSRKENGEGNIKLKYTNGVPKIVNIVNSSITVDPKNA